MSSAADDAWHVPGLRRLCRDLWPGADHAAYPGQLGEYASLIVNRGREPAEAVFPRLSRHLQACASCRGELQVLIAQL